MTAPNTNQLPLILPRAPILSSDGSDWKNIHFVHFQQPPCKVPEHILPFHVLCLNVGQPVQLEQTLDGQRVSLNSVRGDIAIYPALATRTFCWDKDTEFFNLMLEPAFLTQVSYEVFGSDRIELTPHLSAIHDSFLQQMGLALKTSLEIDGEGSHLYADSMAQALVVHLLARYSSNSRPIQPLAGSFTQQQWRQISSFIEANLHDSITLTQLAAIANLSPYHFAHSFKKSTGISPHQYVIRCRLERGKQLIEQGNLSLAAIAQTVGFASQGHFTRHFKRLVGITPKVYSQHRHL